MIFVTVGTHEQAFDRVIKEIDRLKKENIITEDVFVQTGYSTYEPEYCDWSKFVKFDEMSSYISNARIVITHGGPASFLSVLEQKKTPIVVPRKIEFNEHVNNHQLDFAIKIRDLGYKIIVVDDIAALGDNILNYQSSDEAFKSNNQKFNNELIQIINELLGVNK